MATAFDVLAEDFSRELANIEQLITSSYEGSASNGVKIAASNASMLLLAASFEEYTRECLKELASCIIQASEAGLPVPLALRTAVWERALFLLKGGKYGDQNFDAGQASDMLEKLRGFCLEGRSISAVAGWISYNQNNLTVKEFNALFKRAGVADFASSLGRSPELVRHFAAEGPDQAASDLLARWGEFYRERNEVAHSIGSFRTTGSNDVLGYVGLFRVVGQQMASELNLIAGV